MSGRKVIYSLKDIRFRYRKRSAEDNLQISELTIHEAGIYAFLGANGSGKTTLLKLMNGLLISDSGTFLYRGYGLNDRDNPLRQSTVYLHQSPYLFACTVRDNIEFGLKIRKLSAGTIRKKVDEVLQITGLSDLSDTDIRNLSGGETQRAALARAIAIDPEVLLLDEPTSSVDKENIAKLQNVLLELNRNNSTTIIFSSHNEVFSKKLAEKIFLIDRGKLQEYPDNQ